MEGSSTTLQEKPTTIESPGGQVNRDASKSKSGRRLTTYRRMIDKIYKNMLAS
jgi:hypothetical protein